MVPLRGERKGDVAVQLALREDDVPVVLDLLIADVGEEDLNVEASGTGEAIAVVGNTDGVLRLVLIPDGEAVRRLNTGSGGKRNLPVRRRYAEVFRRVGADFKLFRDALVPVQQVDVPNFRFGRPDGDSAQRQFAGRVRRKDLKLRP